MSTQDLLSGKTIADLRKEYARAALDEASAYADPFQQFEQWFHEAMMAQIAEPNAMTLATVGLDGRPRARVVLIKGLDGGGFSFFTNYESDKGKELAAHPFAALQFHWVDLERQVRIEGHVAKLTEQESDQYYHSRPVNSRLGAWASPQSQVIANRSVIEQREAEFRARFGDAPPRPSHWGGYRLTPDRFEFWQGRPSRLHDRLRYTCSEGRWIIERLAP